MALEFPFTGRVPFPLSHSLAPFAIASRAKSQIGSPIKHAVHADKAVCINEQQSLSLVWATCCEGVTGRLARAVGTLQDTGRPSYTLQLGPGENRAGALLRGGA